MGACQVFDAVDPASGITECHYKCSSGKRVVDLIDWNICVARVVECGKDGCTKCSETINENRVCFQCQISVSALSCAEPDKDGLAGEATSSGTLTQGYACPACKKSCDPRTLRVCGVLNPDGCGRLCCPGCSELIHGNRICFACQIFDASDTGSDGADKGGRGDGVGNIKGNSDGDGSGNNNATAANSAPEASAPATPNPSIVQQPAPRFDKGKKSKAAIRAESGWIVIRGAGIVIQV